MCPSAAAGNELQSFTQKGASCVTCSRSCLTPQPGVTARGVPEPLSVGAWPGTRSFFTTQGLKKWSLAGAAVFSFCPPLLFTECLLT